MSTADRHTLMRRLKATVDDLAYPYSHAEVVETSHQGKPHRYRHITRHPPLITQLARAVETSSGDGGQLSGFRGIFTSEPAARLEAIDRHQAIAQECLVWLDTLDIQPRRLLCDNVRALVGGAGRLDTDGVAELVRAVRSWWCWARTITGWDSVPWKPHGPCPVCDRIGPLRVREAARTAICVECGAWWDAGTIGALGEFIKLWSASQRT